MVDNTIDQSVSLYGFAHSVYSWIARWTLHEKGVAYRWVEVNPFAEDVDPEYMRLHPFKRVPALVHGEFSLYETGAITRYVDEAFEGRKLQPSEPASRARLNQIIAIVDAYGYRPLVRQAFAHGTYLASLGFKADPKEHQKGLQAAPRLLEAFDALVQADRIVEQGPMLDDIHLGAMISYFAADPDGAAMLPGYPTLARWWSAVSSQSNFIATRPELSVFA